MVAVWQTFTPSSRVLGRARTAAGLLKPIATFSIAAQNAFVDGLAVGANGKALVAWGQSDGTTQCSGSPCYRVAGAPGP